MTQSAPGKITNIQGLRGLAALLVFVAHLVGGERDYGGGPQTLLPSFLEIGVTGVDLFFVISGFVMVYVTWPASQSSDSGKTSSALRRQMALKFLTRRISRIYPFYWFVTALLLLLYGGKYVLFGEATPLHAPVRAVLLFPADALPIVPVGWTLIHEMYFYLVMALALVLPLRLLPGVLLLWGSGIAIAYGAGLHTTNAWTMVIVSPLTYEFLLGAAVAFLTLKGITHHAGPVLVIALCWLACLLGPLGGALFPDAVTNHGIRTLIFAMPFALLVYAAVGLEWRLDWQVPRWAGALGDASYALYLVHIPVFLVVGKLIDRFTGPGLVDNGVLIVAFCVATFAATAVTHLYVEKPLIAWSRRLLASRAAQDPSAPQSQSAY
ncbi:MAG: acyltransferase [Pseudomonadota bacterium]